LQGNPVEVRNAAARRLMGRGRFREALDVLNEAIRIDPRYAESFENRAAVFERLGMYPQADADRRKVADLGGVQQPVVIPPATQPPPQQRGRPRSTPVVPAPPNPTPDATEETDSATETAASSPEDESPPDRRVVAVPRYMAPPRGPDSGGALKSFATILVSVGLLVAAGIGIYLALSTIGEAIDGDGGTASGPEATATETGTTGPTPSPSPLPEDVEQALQGDPFSFDTFEEAWADEGITATPGGVSTAVSGFATTPVDVTLTMEDASMLVAMLVYDSAQGPSQDWDLGNPPTPKLGRNIPAGARVLYNRNVVVVVIESDDSMREAMTAGFLAP
jgi:TPR repeat